MNSSLPGIPEFGGKSSIKKGIVQGGSRIRPTQRPRNEAFNSTGFDTQTTGNRHEPSRIPLVGGISDRATPSTKLGNNAKLRSFPNTGESSLLENVMSFYGVGRARGIQICEEFGYLPRTRYSSRSNEAVSRIHAYTRGEGVLREVMSQRIKQKVKVGTYSGIRMRRGLPSRGQRTQANGSTARRLNIGRT